MIQIIVEGMTARLPGLRGAGGFAALGRSAVSEQDAGRLAEAGQLTDVVFERVK